MDRILSESGGDSEAAKARQRVDDAIKEKIFIFGYGLLGRIYSKDFAGYIADPEVRLNIPFRCHMSMKELSSCANAAGLLSWGIGQMICIRA